jgi:type IV pilus assembly protein PilX|tara:strand:- start:1386 stop:1931 length:546 start_codon:yes stop_codon:yes gene_type:complete
MKMNQKRIDRQAGVVLVFCLVMLLLLTMLGLSGVQSTSMQERMARNARDVNLAFQATEAAIRDAEKFLETVNGVGPFQTANANDNGLYLEADFDELPNWRIDGLWEGAQVITAPTQIPGVAVQPKYIIEYVRTATSDPDTLNIDNIGQDTGGGLVDIYRVTAYGTGGSPTSHVMIQSTYGI